MFEGSGTMRVKREPRMVDQGHGIPALEAMCATREPHMAGIGDGHCLWAVGATREPLSAGPTIEYGYDVRLAPRRLDQDLDVAYQHGGGDSRTQLPSTPATVPAISQMPVPQHVPPMLHSPAVHPPSGPVWSGFVRPRDESFQGSDRGDTARMRHVSVLAGALGVLPSMDEDHTCMVSSDLRPAGEHMSSRAVHHRSTGSPRSLAGAGGGMDTSVPRGNPRASHDMHRPAAAGDMSAETAWHPPHGDVGGVAVPSRMEMRKAVGAGSIICRMISRTMCRNHLI
eukprot:6478223-Amphidinium_carterae.4